MATLKDLSSQLRQLQKQIPFATAQAMTRVVRKVEAAQKTDLGAKRSPNEARRERVKQRAPKLIICFGDALPMQPIQGYMKRANTMATLVRNDKALAIEKFYSPLINSPVDRFMVNAINAVEMRDHRLHSCRGCF